MFIDFRVNPAFYKVIESDEQTNKNRHSGFHIYKNSFAPMEHIQNQMNIAGLDKLVIMSDDRRSEFGHPLVSNDEIKRLVDTSNGKFLGIASVDPLADNSETELENAFKNLNLLGLKLNLSISKIYPNDERVIKLIDICVKYNKPIIFDSGFAWEKESVSKYSRPIMFEEILFQYPNVKICLTQFGWPWVEETAMLMLKYRNLYTDTGLLYFDNAQEFYTRVLTKEVEMTWIDRSLRHQVMFASGNPRFEQIRMAKALDNLGFRESTLELIKGKNALVFLGLSDEN